MGAELLVEGRHRPNFTSTSVMERRCWGTM